MTSESMHSCLDNDFYFQMYANKKATYWHDFPMDSSPSVPILWQPLTSRCVSSGQPAAIASKLLSLKKKQSLRVRFFNFLHPFPIAHRLLEVQCTKISVSS